MARLFYQKYQWELWLKRGELEEYGNLVREQGFKQIPGNSYSFIREDDGDITFIDVLLKAIPSLGGGLSFSAIERSNQGYLYNRPPAKDSVDVIDILDNAILSRGRRYRR